VNKARLEVIRSMRRVWPVDIDPRVQQCTHYVQMNSTRDGKLSAHPQPSLTRYFLNNTVLDTWEVMRRAVVDKLGNIYIVCPLQVSRLSMASTYSDE